MTEYPRNSSTVVPSLGGTSAPGDIAVMFPASIVTLRSGICAAPVPSITSTCARTTLGVVTRRYLRTCGERVSTRWARATCEYANDATLARASDARAHKDLFMIKPREEQSSDPLSWRAGREGSSPGEPR